MCTKNAELKELGGVPLITMETMIEEHHQQIRNLCTSICELRIKLDTILSPESPQEATPQILSPIDTMMATAIHNCYLSLLDVQNHVQEIISRIRL